MSNFKNTSTGDLDYRWHLAEDDIEISTTEVEFALMRSFEGFGRWQTECLSSVSDIAASGSENALLHIIRMHDRAKTMQQLAYLTNRQDIPNIQYSLRKLVRLELVAKKGYGRTGVTYEVTEKGRQVTDDYSKLRQQLLIEQIRGLPGFKDRLNDAIYVLNILSGLYEEASRVAATHRR